MITHLLTEFAKNPFDSEVSLELASLYKQEKQYAGAISFYTRALETTESKEIQYICLLSIGNCFVSLGNRIHAPTPFYKHAISLMPNRPEAYYLLSRFNEWIKRYDDSYLIADLGLRVCDFNLPKLSHDVEYVGKYGLIFEKAVSAWWWGKTMESRRLFQELVDKYRNIMDQNHLNLVNKNITSLGSGPESVSFVRYDGSKHDSLRFKFKNSTKIKRNYSQVFQDMFILGALNGKRNGTYLEIGSADPFHGNNTALLEKEFDWTGIGIEQNENLVRVYREHRKNKILCEDARFVDYEKILSEISDENGFVDYLQIDCEPSSTSFEILLMIPFGKFKFGIITYEHDHYVDITRTYREKSRKYLQSLGYVLVVSDVSPNDCSPFEDWWMHSSLLNETMIGNGTPISNYIYIDINREP